MSPSSAEIPSTALPAALSRVPERKHEPAHSAPQPCTELPVAAYMPKLLTQLLAQDLSQNAKPDFLTWHHTGITTVSTSQGARRCSGLWRREPRYTSAQQIKTCSQLSLQRHQPSRSSLHWMGTPGQRGFLHSWSASREL